MGSSMVMMWQALSFVDLVNEGSQRGGFAAAGWAGDENDSRAEFGRFGKLARKVSAP